MKRNYTIKPGTKPNEEKDKKVLFYRQIKGLSFREIAKLTDEDKKNVYLRYKRALVSYPQEQNKTKLDAVGKLL